MVACFVGTPAAAQTASGPFSGLFGGDQGNRADQGQALVARGSLFGAYDRDVPGGGESGSSSDPRLLQSGMLGGLNGSLTYFRPVDRGGFRVNGWGSVLDYSASPDLIPSVGANLGL